MTTDDISIKVASYRITDELGTVLGSVAFDRDALLKALNAVSVPPPPPGYTLRLGDDPAEAIADLSAGDSLRVVAGDHPHNIHLTKPINVIGEPGATLSGWRSGLAWERYGTIGEDNHSIYRLRWDRQALGLSHRVVTNAAFLAAPDGAARLAAHNFATQPEMVRYDGEILQRVSLSGLDRQNAFQPDRHAYDDKEGWLYISLPPGADLDLLEVATLPQLFTAADGVAGVTVEGLTLTGAANTHKQGAFELHSDGNTISNVTVQMVNSLGYSLRGIGLNINDAYALDCGQMGHWIKAQKSQINIIHERSNWRGSDAGWHASNKFEQSIDNDITIYARQTDGVGAWFDVGNHRNRVHVISDRASKNALMVEHYAEDNVFDLDITGTQSLGRWIGADVQIQSNVKRNTFTGRISGGAVPYWLVYKTSESRGPSGPNTFRDIETGGRPMRIEGGQHEKDVFENIT